VWQPSFSYDFSFPLDAQDMVCSDQHFIHIVDRQSIASLQDSAPWQTYQVSIPGFGWQLVGGRVLRYRSISVQSLALLPATCTTWFLSTCVDILVQNSWFVYRCRLSCSMSWLFYVCCKTSMLSWYRNYADSIAVFSSFHGIVWLSHML